MTHTLSTIIRHLRDGTIAFMVGVTLAVGVNAWSRCGVSLLRQELRLSSTSGDFPWPSTAILTTTDGGDTFSVRVDLDIEEDSGLSHNLVLVSSGNVEQP